MLRRQIACTEYNVVLYRQLAATVARALLIWAL